MKKNRLMSLAAVLLVLTLVTACFVGGTFAKYTSEATGEATATVAKWAFNVGATNIAESQTFTFNLFETINDTNGGADADETDVADGKIAPGTKGSFNLVVTNASDVNATYDVVFDFSAFNDLPLVFTGNGNVEDKAIAKGASETITVSWEWPFDGDDVADTADGITAGSFKATATITATQVD